MNSIFKPKSTDWHKRKPKIVYNIYRVVAKLKLYWKEGRNIE